jgi:3-oxoacyl-(acyl-carrier-protein) synthase
MHLNNMRAVITGIGSVTSLGNTSSSFWSNLLEGQSQISQSLNPTRRLSSTPKSFMSEISETKGTLGLQYAFLAGSEAISSAKVPPGELNLLIESCMSTSHDFALSKSLKDMLKVPNSEVKFSPLGSLDGVCSAISKIKSGLCDKVLIVGVSHSVDTYFYEKVLPLGILNTVDLGNPTRAVKAFDKNSRGTVLAEGATALLIESEDSALHRGAEILARVRSYSRNSDGKYLLRPRENSEGLVRAIAACVEKGEFVDLAVMDGLANVEKDFSEAFAIDSLLKYTPITSVQGYTGMLLGALGPTQLAAAAMTIWKVIYK